LHTVTQQLTYKKPRLGPKVATQDWWIEKIKATKEPKYIHHWPQITEYQVGCFRALAEYDYEVLGEGIETPGVPNFGQFLEYPAKLELKPTWSTLSTQEWKDLKLWTWIDSAKAVGRPISEETSIWHSYFSVESYQIKAKEFLAPFRAENQKEFDILLEVEHNSVPYSAGPISSIVFGIPQGEWYKSLNNTLQDSRNIPITEEGLVIKKVFLKYYLEQRLGEYLALGGLKELIEREPLIEAGHKLPDPFYWDLWGNLDHLREEYKEFCDDQHVDPEADEQSTASFDTQ